MGKQSRHVFISYAREDYNLAKRLYVSLSSLGINAWLDRENLLPGQNWPVEIAKAIRASSFFLALLSTQSVSKTGYVQSELKLALEVLDTYPESEVYLIPIRIDDCEPTSSKLKVIHRVDLFPSYENGLEQILRVLLPRRDDFQSLTLQAAQINTDPFQKSLLDLINHAASDFSAIWYTRLSLADLVN